MLKVRLPRLKMPELSLKSLKKWWENLTVERLSNWYIFEVLVVLLTLFYPWLQFSILLLLLSVLSYIILYFYLSRREAKRDRKIYRWFSNKVFVMVFIALSVIPQPYRGIIRVIMILSYCIYLLKKT